MGEEDGMRASMKGGSVSLVALAVVVLLWFVHKLRAFLTRSAPVGYEDETGFHFGVPPRRKGHCLK
jgi:hypothetical protein